MNPEKVLPRHLLQESAIPGLINWSIPWIGTFGAVSFLVGAQAIFFSVREMSVTAPSETLLWGLAKGAAYLNLAFFLYQLFRSAKSFVNSESEKILNEVMTYLSASWVGLGVVLVYTLTAQFSQFGGGFLFGEGLSLAFVALVPVISIATLLLEAKASRGRESFIRYINPFATKNLPRLRFLSVFAILGGILSVSFALVVQYFDISGGWIGGFLTGVSLILLGCALQWYRRSVRDIQRNPTPIFFERTLNRLNLFWLCACVFFVCLFLSGFLPRS